MKNQIIIIKKLCALNFHIGLVKVWIKWHFFLSNKYEGNDLCISNFTVLSCWLGLIFIYCSTNK